MSKEQQKVEKILEKYVGGLGAIVAIFLFVIITFIAISVPEHIKWFIGIIVVMFFFVVVLLLASLNPLVRKGR